MGEGQGSLEERIEGLHVTINAYGLIEAGGIRMTE
jgi:hypothetical protein